MRIGPRPPGYGFTQSFTQIITATSRPCPLFLQAKKTSPSMETPVERLVDTVPQETLGNKEDPSPKWVKALTEYALWGVVWSCPPSSDAPCSQETTEEKKKSILLWASNSPVYCKDGTIFVQGYAQLTQGFASGLTGKASVEPAEVTQQDSRPSLWTQKHRPGWC